MTNEKFVVRGLDPPAGPKPLRRSEGPRIHRTTRALVQWVDVKRIDCRDKPGNDN
jgi:hypothetical protein